MKKPSPRRRLPAQTRPSAPKWPVTLLPNGGGKGWLAQGIDDLLSIDPTQITSVIHRRVYDATLTGNVYHDIEGARTAMEGWTYPRIWLDFETVSFANPRWIGTHPRRPLPFQFSAHIEQMNEEVVHREFLSLDGLDPRRPCAEALLAMIPQTGAVVAYNASVERGCINGLASAFPDLEEQLRAIAARVVDLLPITRANWYHRDQRGSWSIKAVLPTVSKLDYTDLTVTNGRHAELAYREAIEISTSESRRQEIDAALRAYCRRDTEAMIVVASALLGKQPMVRSAAAFSRPL